VARESSASYNAAKKEEGALMGESGADSDTAEYYSDHDSYFEHLLKASLDPNYQNELTMGIVSHEDADELCEGLTLADLPDVFAHCYSVTGDPWALPRWPSFAGSDLSDDQIDRLEPEYALELLNRLRESTGKSRLVPPSRDEDESFEDFVDRNWDKR
jgi:hypothetical protein